MERKQYQPTEKQIAKWNALKVPAMPSDDEFKAMWKKAHHNVERGWGMGKRDWVVCHEDDSLTCTFEYNLGVWQGRIDALRGVERMETNEYHTNPFHHGYSHGFDGFEKFCREYGRENLQKLSEQYL